MSDDNGRGWFVLYAVTCALIVVWSLALHPVVLR